MTVESLHFDISLLKGGHLEMGMSFPFFWGDFQQTYGQRF